MEEYQRRVDLLRDALKRDKSITYNWHDPQTSYLEAIFSRGDRRLADVLEWAWQHGAKFDSWSEYFDYQRWMDALRENQNSPERQQLQVFEDLVKDREKDYTEARKAPSSLQNAKQALEALNRKLSDCRRALPAEQMPDAIEQLPEQRQTEQLTAMEQLLREREDSLDQEEFQVRSDLQQLKERQKALQAKIETLEKGVLDTDFEADLIYVEQLLKSIR